jgi:hypothetical protein
MCVCACVCVWGGNDARAVQGSLVRVGVDRIDVRGVVQQELRSNILAVVRAVVERSVTWTVRDEREPFGGMLQPRRCQDG